MHTPILLESAHAYITGTVCMRSRSIQPIYVVSLFYICSIQNADDVIETHISIWRPGAGNICPSVYVLNVEKMT